MVSDEELFSVWEKTHTSEARKVICVDCVMRAKKKFVFLHNW